MRKMQCREQGGFVAGIQRRHEAVEYSERRAYRSLIRLDLSLVDTDGASPPVEILRGHVIGNVSRPPRERCADSCRLRSFRLLGGEAAALHRRDGCTHCV